LCRLQNRSQHGNHCRGKPRICLDHRRLFHCRPFQFVLCVHVCLNPVVGTLCFDARGCSCSLKPKV
jgi:hypothetical protein